MEEKTIANDNLKTLRQKIEGLEENMRVTAEKHAKERVEGMRNSEEIIRLTKLNENSERKYDESEAERIKFGDELSVLSDSCSYLQQEAEEKTRQIVQMQAQVGYLRDHFHSLLLISRLKIE